MPLHTVHAPITAQKEPRASTVATRGAETGTACWAKQRQPSAGQAHGHSHAPPSPVHTHPWHDARQGTTRRPHPHVGGAGWASLTGSTTRSSDTPPTAAARGGRWERETTPPLGLRHLRQPGTLQGHHRGPGATHSARPGGEQRGMGTALPATGRAAHPTKTPRGKRECPLRQRAPHPRAP